nr:MAG TPA: hypothetical protein [Caudoviricetes sp.]
METLTPLSPYPSGRVFVLLESLKMTPLEIVLVTALALCVMVELGIILYD